MNSYDLKQLEDKISHNEQLLRVNAILFERHRVSSIKVRADAHAVFTH